MSMIGMFVATTDEDLDALLEEPGAIEPYLRADEDGRRTLDVDKAWHGIHFLLTGDAWDGEPPLDFIIGGGESIGDIDLGYGPARAFDSEAVRELARALAPITVEKLFERWDRGAIFEAELYGVDPDDRAGGVEYLGGHFERLKAFVGAAARDGLGLIVYLC
jgi:hypothetical protein